MAYLPAVAENFYIENYDVDMVVNKNKSVAITENIDVYFTSSSHGIFRDIPYKNATITLPYVLGDKFQIIRGFNTITFKIGDPDKYITGKHHYNINYNYNYHDNKDEFYHNIIGTSWGVPINKVKFRITMPENFDKNKAGLSIGKYGTKGFEDGAVFRMDDNVVSGETFRVLQPNEGITFRTELPKGYFNKYTDYGCYILLGLIILCTLVTFFIWLRYGKEDIVIPILSFEPPEEIKNVLEAEIYYSEHASSKGIAGLLIELAHKGFLKIEDTESDYDSHINFTITKLKDFDSYDEKKSIPQGLKNENLSTGDKFRDFNSFAQTYSIEQEFMNALFENKDSITDADLKSSNTFYKHCYKILENTVTTVSKRMYTQISLSKSLNFCVNFCIMIILACFLLFTNGIQYSQVFILNSHVNWAAVIFICLMLSSAWARKIGFILFITIAFNIVAFYNAQILTFEYWTQILFCLFCLVVAINCASNLPKKNKNACYALGKLIGLKKYIQTAEKHELELLVKENPELFYNILPYAYVLGVSKVWIDKFKSIMQINQEFYNNRFDADNIIRYADKISEYSQPSIENGGISRNSSGSRSSFGGGGHSGGGSGGGGGRSW